MKLRRFNETGMEQMEVFLDSLKTDDAQPFPDALLESAALSEEVEPTIEIEKRQFANRFEAAEYLHGQLADSGLSDVERDKGLWAWLALFYFDQLCPPDKNGQYKPGARARYIPAVSNFQRYYRHLLARPYRICRALALLFGALDVLSDDKESARLWFENVFSMKRESGFVWPKALRQI